MAPVVAACVGISMAAALGYLAAVGRPDSLWRSALKTLAVLPLAAVSWSVGAPPLLVIALGLGALGDWFLSRPGARAFQLGAASFALGHLAYAALFLTHDASDPARLWAAPQVALAPLVVLFGLAMGWLFWRRAGAERVVALGYIPFILAMAVAALAVPPLGVCAWLPVAVLAFLGSDTLLALTRFGIVDRSRLTDRAVWVSYYGAQLGFFAIYAGFGVNWRVA